MWLLNSYTEELFKLIGYILMGLFYFIIFKHIRLEFIYQLHFWLHIVSQHHADLACGADVVLHVLEDPWGTAEGDQLSSQPAVNPAGFSHACTHGKE